ncbi:hypothetical protein PQX77_006480 [Marasmius sp. AFHP31]|nr:hypothetical protein PQX77_006480 [Marasmius sp. AFHP31]
MGAHQGTDSDDNQQQIVLGPEVFLKIAATGLVSPLEEQIRQASEQEAEVLEGLRDLKAQGPFRLVNGLLEWEEDNGLVYHRGRVYVPPGDELRKEVVRHIEPA